LDETEIYTREQFMEVRALLNAGYRKDQYAIRIVGSEQRRILDLRRLQTRMGKSKEG